MLFDAVGSDARTNFGQETLRDDLVWDLTDNWSLRVSAQQAKVSNHVYWGQPIPRTAGGIYLNSMCLIACSFKILRPTQRTQISIMIHSWAGRGTNEIKPTSLRRATRFRSR